MTSLQVLGLKSQEQKEGMFLRYKMDVAKVNEANKEQPLGHVEGLLVRHQNKQKQTIYSLCKNRR